MILLKTPEQIKIMHEGGKISSYALKEGLRAIKPGVTTLEIDKVIEDAILSKGGIPAFKGFEGYGFASCININEGIVHGLPSKYVIKRGDIVSLDLGTLYKGLNTDLSYTVEVETNKETTFLEIGKKALKKSVEACIVGNNLGTVSNGMQKVIERAGYSVSEELTGHGIGEGLHEEPYVMCYGKKGRGLKLVEGMVLAIEAIYQKGKPDIVLEDDEWTLSTEDRSLAGLFEQTVAITKDGPLILTEY